MSSSRTRGSSPRRRHWRALVAGVMGLYLLLLALGALALRLLMPEERLKKAVVATLEARLGRRISVGAVHIDPFSGMALQEVSIQTAMGADSTFPIRTATVERVRLHYRLLPLLKRRVEIYEISLHKPRLDLVFVSRRQREGPAPSRQTQTRADSAVGGTAALPVALELFRAEILDAACTVTMANDTSEMAFGVDGLSFVASSLRVPRGKGDPWSTTEGRAQLTCKRAPAFFRQSLRGSSEMAISGLLHVVLAVEAHTLSDVLANLELGADQARVELPPAAGPLGAMLSGQRLPLVELRAQAAGNVAEGNYLLEHLSVALGRQPLVVLRGALRDLATKPTVQVEVEDGHIPLARLLGVVRPLLAASDYAHLLPSRLSGTLSLAGTQLNGELPRDLRGPSLTANARLALREVSLTLPELVDLQRLNFSVSATAWLDSVGVHEGEGNASLSLRGLLYHADALPLEVAGASLVLAARVAADSGLFHLQAQLNADSALGSTVASQVHLRAGRVASLWRGRVNVDVDHLPLSPLSQDQLRGVASASFAGTIEGLDDISVRGTLALDSLAFGAERGAQLLPPVRVGVTGNMRITPWSVVALDSLLLAFSDFASARLHGEFDLAHQRVSFALDDLVLYHQALPALLPRQVEEQLGELSLSGATHVRGRGVVRLASGQPEFAAEAQLSSAVGGQLPALGLGLSGARLHAVATVGPDLGKCALDLRVDTLLFAALRRSPISGTSASFEVLLPQLRRLTLARGELSVPAFATRALLTGTIEPEPAGARASLQLDLKMQAEDTIRIADAAALVGELQTAATLGLEGSLVNVAGRLEIPFLTVSLPGDISLRGIKATIPFAQQFDVGTMRMMASPAERYAFSGPAGHYPMLFAAHFTHAVPEQGWLTVEHLRFAGYGADNLRMEVFIGGGKVLVPTMLLDAYGGNFGGRIAAEFPTVALADATYSVEGQLSGLNSALLTARRGQPPEKGIVNANFSFAGKGLDVTKSIEVQGSFRITEIGPRVADNLLRALDPQGLDAGIRSARFFINHGFKPRLMSFDLRHGHLYPSIRLSQPWYFPVRIGGGRVELARIPLAFFLQMLKQEALPAY